MALIIDDERKVTEIADIGTEISVWLTELGISFRVRHVQLLRQIWLVDGNAYEIPLWIGISKVSAEGKRISSNGGALCHTLGGRKANTKDYIITIFLENTYNPMYRRRFSLR